MTSLCGQFQPWKILIIVNEAINGLCEEVYDILVFVFDHFQETIYIFLRSYNGLHPFLLLFLLLLLLSFHPLQSVKSNVKGPFEVKTWRAPPAAAVPPLLRSHRELDLSLTDRCLVKLHTDRPEVAFKRAGRHHWTAGKQTHRYSLWTCIFRLVLKWLVDRQFQSSINCFLSRKNAKHSLMPASHLWGFAAFTCFISLHGISPSIQAHYVTNWSVVIIMVWGGGNNRC